MHGNDAGAINDVGDGLFGLSWANPLDQKPYDRVQNRGAMPDHGAGALRNCQ